MSHDSSQHLPCIPLVVHVGFAGKRFFYDAKKHPEIDEARFFQEVEWQLADMLRGLRAELGLSKMHFFCGISQVAIGADTVFTRACHQLHEESGGWDFKQRIFLPQPTEAFLTARSENGTEGKEGTADFTTAQADAARDLLKLGHIIEVRPVSTSVNRTEQFEDVTLDLARVSDVCMALIREDEAAGREDSAAVSGGTLDLVKSAAIRHRPVLMIKVSVADGHAVLRKEWQWNFPRSGLHTSPPAPAKFTPPALPAVLDGCTVAAGDYAEAVKKFAGRRAARHQWFFKWAACIIIGTHVVATALAVIGLCFGKTHGPAECASNHLPEVHAAPDASREAGKHPGQQANWVANAKPWLLGGEVILLLIGLGVHFGLHKGHAVRKWAIARLIAETARSVTNMNGARGYLGHLFTLPMPEFLRSLLRTLNFFHLWKTRDLRPDDWKRRRCDYIRNRLTSRRGGQIRYYTLQRDKARRRLRVANAVFYLGTTCALTATFIEWLMHPGCPLHCPSLGWLGSAEDSFPLASILLPVISVAALSLAASFDLEARLHTYSEMVDFLRQQRKFLARANSDHEFATLVLQTETRLVGENVNWFSRRAFTGVA